MSRIGKKVIILPSNISVNIENQKIIVKGPFGTLIKPILPNIKILINHENIKILRTLENHQTRAYHGLMNVLVQNMIFGVTQKFTKVLILEGIGYKYQMINDTLKLLLGYTHPITFQVPEDLNILLESPTKLIISGIDKEKVSLFASQIYNVMPPEPYKGKGIHYEGQVIIRKAGKTRK